MNRAAIALLTGLLIMVPAWAQSAFPAPDSATQNRRPNIGFNFGQPARNMQLIIDGRDWTNESNKNSNTINFLPAFDLNPGLHQVEAHALNILGLPIGTNWRFTINPSQHTPATTPGIVRVNPVLDSTINESRPRISANYSENLRNGRIWLDGNEQTSQVSLSGGTLAFTPNQDLSPGRHQVASQVTYVSGRTDSYSWSFEVKPPAQQPASQSFLNLSPPAGARIRNLRPYISVDVAGNINNVRLLVDNHDVTSQCERSGNRIAWNPNYDLQPGAHGARVEGQVNNGMMVNSDWNFVLEAGSQNNNPNTNPDINPNASIDFGVDEPTTGDRVRPNFEVTGNAPAGSNVRVVLRPLPKKNKVVQFNGTTDSQGYYTIPVSATWATKGMRMEITVTVLNKRGRPAADSIVLEVYRR